MRQISQYPPFPQWFMATKAESTLQKSQMQTRTDAGSLMPDGLTASLSREELRDLIAYLASLGKEEKK